MAVVELRQLKTRFSERDVIGSNMLTRWRRSVSNDVPSDNAMSTCKNTK